MPTAQLKRRRARLWRQDPCCHWCGCVTVLLDVKPRRGVSMPDEMATIDHLDDRYSSARGQRKGEERTVLACLKCNHDREREATKAQPANFLALSSGAHASWPPKVRAHV